MAQAGSESAANPGSAATLAVLLLIVLALFVPFLNKAFNIDDPLFIWAAKHIRYHPLDFYGFDVSWYKTAMPMSAVTKNPPLFSYFLAGFGMLFGWGEVAMHLAVLVSLTALALGTFRLAGQLDAQPLQAALISICTPVVLVSGTTVMCDVPMVALWVWAVSFWIQGNEAGSRDWPLCAAGVLIAASGLTKYFGASLVPLLASYSLMRRTPARRWLPYLLIPVALFCLYEWLTYLSYGIGMFSDAFAYSSDFRQKLHPDSFIRIVDSLSFTGGGLISVAFFAPLLFRSKGRLICLAGFSGTALATWVWGLGAGSDFSLSLQQAVFIATAGILSAIALSDLSRNRDADSLLLALWVLGTFVFAGMVNWTVNERIILPMAPAAGILVSRRLLRMAPGCGRLKRYGFACALAPALLLSLLVTLADYRWAGEIRKEVQRVPFSGSNSGQRLWFQGHWGFQYYMEQIGGKHLDFRRSEVHAGDLLVRPSFTTNFESLPDDAFELVDKFPAAPLSFLAVMDPSARAGFYSSVVGPLPYAFGPVTPEIYWVHAFKQNIRFVKQVK